MFTGILGAKIALGAIFTLIFFVLCFVSLTVADRTAPTFRPAGPEDELLTRYHDFVEPPGVAGAGGGVAAVRPHRRGGRCRRSGAVDPVHPRPVASASRTPPSTPTWASTCSGCRSTRRSTQWLFAALIIILLITLVADYLNGGIRLQSPLQRVTPQVKAHLSVLLAAAGPGQGGRLLAGPLPLTFSTRGTVKGATYTDVHA